MSELTDRFYALGKKKDAEGWPTCKKCLKKKKSRPKGGG